MVDPGASIQVGASRPGLAFWLRFGKPTLRVDQMPAEPVPWGERVVPVLPGRHTVGVWLQLGKRRIGSAELAVQVPPGAVVIVRWRAPVWIFGKASMTHSGTRAAVVDVRQPAGWYPDPTGRRPLRWWDGAEWTGHAQEHGVVIHDGLEA